MAGKQRGPLGSNIRDGYGALGLGVMVGLLPLVCLFVALGLFVLFLILTGSTS